MFVSIFYIEFYIIYIILNIFLKPNLLICCFLDLSQTHFRGVMRDTNKNRRKTGKHLHAWKYKIFRINIYFLTIVFCFQDFFNDQYKTGFAKQQIY